jgi:hypothetical protein
MKNPPATAGGFECSVISGQCCQKLALGNVCSLLATVALNNIEGNCLALFQSLEALSVDSGEMYEYILAALSGDETITLLRIEPLNCTLIHVGTLHIKIIFDSAFIKKFTYFHRPLVKR